MENKNTILILSDKDIISKDIPETGDVNLGHFNSELRTEWREVSLVLYKKEGEVVYRVLKDRYHHYNKFVTAEVYINLLTGKEYLYVVAVEVSRGYLFSITRKDKKLQYVKTNQELTDSFSKKLTEENLPLFKFVPFGPQISLPPLVRRVFEEYVCIKFMFGKFPLVLEIDGHRMPLFNIRTEKELETLVKLLQDEENN